jgi:dTMP kinase
MLSDLERPAEADVYISAAIQAALVLDIQQAREAGQVILLDRGPLSLAAYQIYGSGVAEELAWPHVDSGLKQLAPDLTLFYDGAPATMLARAKQKTAGDYFENKPIDYFEKVAQGYQQAIKRYDLPLLSIDANQPVDAVFAGTITAIEQALADKLKQL